MTSIHAWSTTPSDNATADVAVNWAENQNPDTVNNSARQMMARQAEWLDDVHVSRMTTGSVNLYSVTGASTPGGWVDGLRFGCRAHIGNTGPAAINYNNYGFKALRRRSGVALLPGEIDVGAPLTVTYVQATDECIIVSGGAPIAGASADIYARILPVGTPIPWPTEIAPAGYIGLNGQDVSRSVYSELFAAYGTRYGAGDGVTTFRLPRYNDGSFIRGWDLANVYDVDRTTRTDRGDGTTGNLPGTRQAEATRSHAHTASLSVSVTGGTGAGGAHTPTLTNYKTVLVGVGAGIQAVVPGVGPIFADPVADHTHTVSATGTATGTTNFSTGAVTETRPSNITVYWITLALPALASAGTLGVGGLSYRFDPGTTDVPLAAGVLRLNSSTPSAATALYMSETDAYGANLAGVIAGITVNSVLYVYKVGSPGTYCAYTTTLVANNGGVYQRFYGLTHVGSNGAFEDGDNLAFIVMRAGAAGVGSPGPSGSDGGIRWTFSTTTTMAAPGTGLMRLNNAAPASVTQIAFANTSAETGNPSMSGWLNSWDDSASTIKGQIIIRDLTAPATQMVYSVTGAVVDNGTWFQIPVAHRAGTVLPTNSDSLAISFSPAGDRGTDGGGVGTVTSVVFERGLYGGTVTGSGTVGIEVPILPGGRPTLTTNTPVMTANATGQTTVYYTPYVHQWCPIYTGTRWEMRDLGGQLSQTTTDTTKSPAACVANTNYDLYVWNDSGTMRCTRGWPWTSATSRGTGVATAERSRINGVWTNAQNITNGPAIGRGTWVGTIRTNSSSQVDWRYGALGAGGTSALFGVYSGYNQIQIPTTMQDSTDSWTYALTAWRRSNASTGMAAFVLQGDGDRRVSASFESVVTSGTSATGLIGIGLNSVSAYSGTPGYASFSTGGVTSKTRAEWNGTFLGWQEIAAIEACSAAATMTFYGDIGAPTLYANGMNVSAWL